MFLSLYIVRRFRSFLTGYATRSCSADGAWNEVDTSDCTRQDFAEVEDTVS